MWYPFIFMSLKIYIYIYMCVDISWGVSSRICIWMECFFEMVHLHGHLPPISHNFQVRWTRHAGHCWRSKDKFLNDILLWTPTYGFARFGQPAKTYIHQLCANTGCCLEDLPDMMDDRDWWWKRVRELRTFSMIWWWW